MKTWSHKNSTLLPAVVDVNSYFRSPWLADKDAVFLVSLFAAEILKWTFFYVWVCANLVVSMCVGVYNKLVFWWKPLYDQRRPLCKVSVYAWNNGYPCKYWTGWGFYIAGVQRLVGTHTSMRLEHKNNKGNEYFIEFWDFLRRGAVCLRREKKTEKLIFAVDSRLKWKVDSMLKMPVWLNRSLKCYTMKQAYLFWKLNCLDLVTMYG